MAECPYECAICGSLKPAKPKFHNAIRAMSDAEARMALHFLSGYCPEGFLSLGVGSDDGQADSDRQDVEQAEAGAESVGPSDTLGKADALLTEAWNRRYPR